MRGSVAGLGQHLAKPRFGGGSPNFGVRISGGMPLVFTMSTGTALRIARQHLHDGHASRDRFRENDLGIGAPFFVACVDIIAVGDQDAGGSPARPRNRNIDPPDESAVASRSPAKPSGDPD